jgi:putative PIN family toxin of toxin-antitoxin system
LIKIVLDTNVLISAIVFGGKPRKIMESILEGSVHLFLSREIMDEFEGVLYRRKFGMSPRVVRNISNELESMCDIVATERRITVITSDPYDNMILECAAEAKADYIISGDAHLLDLGEFEGIKIVNPARFLEIIRQS